MYYSVVEDWDGELRVMSFLGRTRSEERRRAMTMCKMVRHIDTDRDRAILIMRRARVVTDRLDRIL